MKRSPLTIIVLVTFVDLVSFGLIIPLQAVYAERIGASGLTFGCLVGVYALMQLIFNPLLGRWSDRIGRRKVLLISVAGSVLSHMLLGVADVAQSLPLLFVARILDGITGANIATAQAYIADVTKEEDRAKGMGLFGAAFGVGFVVGPSIGAGLAWIGTHVSGVEYGTSWPAFGACVISFLAFLAVWRFLPESRPPGANPSEPFRLLHLGDFKRTLAQPRLRELFGVAYSAIFAFVLLEVTFVYLCVDRFSISVAGTGLIFAYVGLLMACVQGGLVGRLVRRYGEPRLLAVAPFFTALGFAILSLVPFCASDGLAWCLLLFGCVPATFGHGLTGPNVNALISRQAKGVGQGMVLGVGQAFGSLARAIGPPIGGLLYEFLGAPWPYRVGAVLLVLLGLYSMTIAPRQREALQGS